MRPPLKIFFRGGSWCDPPLKLISRGRSCHGPPLQFSVHKIEMVQNIKNSKIKKKKYPSQPPTTTSPVVSTYDFFNETYTLASLGIRTAHHQPRALPYHYTTQTIVTYELCYSFMLTRKLICSGG